MLEILRLSEDMTLLTWFCEAGGTFCATARGIFHACTIVCLSHSLPAAKGSTHLLLGELEATCYPGERYHSSDALSLRVNYREHSHYSLPVPS